MGDLITREAAVVWLQKQAESSMICAILSHEFYLLNIDSWRLIGNFYWCSCVVPLGVLLPRGASSCVQDRPSSSARDVKIFSYCLINKAMPVT